MRQKLSIDYTTAGMANAATDAREAYEKLINKYYQLLLEKLDKNDKEILRQAQRSWIVFRNHELEVSSLLSKRKYSGGGTIQILNLSMIALEIAKERTIGLYQQLEWIVH